MEELQYNKIPKLNPGIVIHHRDNEYIVSFRDSRSHLKINSKLFDLIGYIDNKRSLTQIVHEYNNTFESKIDDEFAYDLLFKKLGYYNIIKSDIEKFDHNKSPAYLKLNTILINEKFTKILEDTKADKLAKDNGQLVGDRIDGREYYITLDQLMNILSIFES